MRSPDLRGEKLHQRGLSSVSRLWSHYTQKREDVGNQFLCPFLRGERGRGIFISIPFKWLCILPFAVHYEKIRIHLCETATNSAEVHSLARKSEHLRLNQIQ